MTKKELYATAKTLNIRGRSRMNKAQLQRAIDMTLGEPMVEKEASMDSKQMLVSLTQDMNLKFDNGERVNIVEMRAPRDEMDVLFNDPSPNLFEDYNLEAEFNEMLELQEGMASVRAQAIGLKQGVIDARKEEYKLKMQAEYALRRYLELKGTFSGLMEKLNRAKERWAALSVEVKRKLNGEKNRWKKTFWRQTMPVKEKRDKAYKEFNELKAKAKAASNKLKAEYAKFDLHGKAEAEVLWDLWWELQAGCSEFTQCSMAGHGRLWGEYFDLMNDEDYLLFVQLDPEDIDDQSLLMDPINTEECLRDSHLADPFSKPDTYERDKVEELPVRTYGYVAPVRDVTDQYRPEAELAAEWEELDRNFMELLDEHDLSYA